ncbi:hypothetical protein INR49_005259 [Caranx melampygus]|nr:hypothetical protein INR49_005259 [Caranx melampygus]
MSVCCTLDPSQKVLLVYSASPPLSKRAKPADDLATGFREQHIQFIRGAYAGSWKTDLKANQKLELGELETLIPQLESSQIQLPLLHYAGGASEAKAHPFFQDLDCISLKSQDPLFALQLKNVEDAGHHGRFGATNQLPRIATRAGCLRSALRCSGGDGGGSQWWIY